MDVYYFEANYSKRIGKLSVPETWKKIEMGRYTYVDHNLTS